MTHSSRTRSPRGLRLGLITLGAALLAASTAWAGPVPRVTRAFSADYKQAKIVKVVAVIRPETRSIVMGFTPALPGLPEQVVIVPYTETTAGLIGEGTDGRVWVVERP